MPVSFIAAEPSDLNKKSEQKKVETPVAPAIAPVPEPVLTDEEMEVKRQELVVGMFGGEPPKKKEEKPKPEEAKEKKDEPKTEVEKKPEETGDGEGKSKKIKKKVPEPEIRTGLDELPDDELDRLSERLRERQTPESKLPAEPANEDADLSSDDLQVLEAVERLQSTRSYKGKNLVQETKKYWKAEADYQVQWEAANPAREFNPDDEDHAPFYKRHRPSYTDADLQVAVEEVKQEKLEQRAVDRVRKEYEPKLNKLEANEAFRREIPEINRSASDSVAFMVAAISPDFKAAIMEADGTLVLNPQTIGRLTEIDPVAVAHLDNEGVLLRVKIQELEKLDRLGKFVQADSNLRIQTPAGAVMPHLEIMEAGTALEKDISSLPRAEQIHEGKSFIGRGALRQKEDEIINSNLINARKQEELEKLYKRVWFITTNDIKDKMIADSVRKIRPFIDASLKLATKYKNGSGLESKKVETDSSAEKPVKPPVKQAPSVAGSSDAVDTQLKAKSQAEENANELVKAFF